MRRPPYQYVDMIRSNIALYYIHMMLRAYFFDDDPQPKPNIFFQNSVTIFGLPYKVILKIQQYVPLACNVPSPLCRPPNRFLEDIIQSKPMRRELFAEDFSA